MGSQESVQREHKGDNRQSRTDYSSRSLEKQYHQDGPGHEVHEDGRPGPHGKIFIENCQVKGGKGTYCRANVVDNRNSVEDGKIAEIFLSLFDAWHQEKEEGYGEGEMDRPFLGAVDDEKTWECQLEKRPGDGDNSDCVAFERPQTAHFSPLFSQ